MFGISVLYEPPCGDSIHTFGRRRQLEHVNRVTVPTDEWAAVRCHVLRDIRYAVVCGVNCDGYDDVVLIFERKYEFCE